MIVPNHMPGVRGFKKIHAFLSTLSLTGTTIAIPDSVYGRVKSTCKLLLYLIVMSPTAMSYSCQGVKENCLTRGQGEKEIWLGGWGLRGHAKIPLKLCQWQSKLTKGLDFFPLIMVLEPFTKLRWHCNSRSSLFSLK